MTPVGGNLRYMQSLIFATETAEHISATHAGDELMTVALVMVGIAMLIAAVATWRVTPRADHH
jgi:hypothetical protein